MSGDVLRGWCERLDLESGGTDDELRCRVERSLAVRHMDAHLLECTRCGFSAPDVDEVDSCPGCGADLAVEGDREEEDEEDDMQARPISIATAKATKQNEEAGFRDARVRQAEAKAKKMLAQIEGEIDELLGDAGCIEWDVGGKLLDIYQKDLWQESGEFGSFAEYVRSRFDFTKQTARAFMRISQHFSRKEASKIPLGHLRLLVSIPDDDARKEMVDRVKKEDMTFRVLADHVKAKRAELGLQTERAGMEDTVLLNVRLKPGIIAEGEWKKFGRGKNAKRSAKFDIGDHTLVIQDLGGEGFVVKLQKPKG